MAHKNLRSMPVRFRRSRSGNVILEADELKAINLSIQRNLRIFLNNPPTSLEQAYALKKLLDTLIQEYNEKFPGSLSPSRIAAKRPCGSIQSSTVLHSSKDLPRFQRVGHTNKRKNIDKQIQLSAQKQKKADHTFDLMQSSVQYDIGVTVEGYTSPNEPHGVLRSEVRLFFNDIVDDSKVKKIGSSKATIQSVIDLDV